MKVSREQFEENHRAIVDAASLDFREHGFGAVSVADLMHKAGLTHGAFYSHFTSKDDLISQAFSNACEGSMRVWETLDTTGQRSPFLAVVERYLRRTHLSRRGPGCPVAALGGEIARASPQVRATATSAIRRMIDHLARLAPGRSHQARRRRALATYASLVGGLVLARAVDDPKLADEILDAVSDQAGLAPRDRPAQEAAKPSRGRAG